MQFVTSKKLSSESCEMKRRKDSVLHHPTASAVSCELRQRGSEMLVEGSYQARAQPQHKDGSPFLPKEPRHQKTGKL